MKKTLFISVCLFGLVACTTTIDKKIVLADYQNNIKEIQNKNTDYTPDDYTKASKLLDKYAFKSVSDGKSSLDKTYRQLLDEAKASNATDTLIIKEYNKQLNELKQTVIISVDTAQYFNEYSPVLKTNYKTFIAQIELTNKSPKQITGIEATLLVKNKAGDVIKKCFIELADKLDTGVSRKDAREYPIVESVDNLFELEANAPDRYTYDWEIEKIIFADGSRLTAPQKPAILLSF